MRVHRAGDRVQEAGFPAYARQTLLNLRRSGLRRLGRERRALGRMGSEPEGRDPADTAETGDVRVALFRLSGLQRACLALRFYEDMDTGDIAHALGMSVEAVRKHIQRGLLRMRSALEEGGES